MSTALRSLLVCVYVSLYKHSTPIFVGACVCVCVCV